MTYMPDGQISRNIPIQKYNKGFFGGIMPYLFDCHKDSNTVIY